MNATLTRQDADAGKSPCGRGLPVLVALAMSCCLISGHAWAEGVAKPELAVPPPATHHQPNAHSLEGRIRTLTRALDLDANQQAEVSKVLEGQREQMEKVWSDTSLAPAYRIVATQAISEKTAVQIRALLTEEQRAKYKPPRKPDSMDPASRPNVEEWMNRKSKQAAPSVSR